MVDLKKLTKDVNKITTFKYLRTHKARDPIIRQVVKDMTEAKEFALGQKDNEELVKAHDALVDKIDNFYNEDYIKKNPGKVLVFPRIKKGASKEPNVVETIRVDKNGEYSVSERQPASDTSPSADTKRIEKIEELKEREDMGKEDEDAKETHTMPDGTVMTGAEHSEDSVPVTPRTEVGGSSPRSIPGTPRTEVGGSTPRTEVGGSTPREEVDEDETIRIEVEDDDDEDEKEEEREEIVEEMMEEKKEEEPRKEEMIKDVESFSIEIPKERRGAEGKTAKQLNDDIKFFLKKYPALLKEEASMYKKADKKSLPVLKDIHKRIVAKLMPEEEMKGKTIGIVLDAEKYLDDKINEILARKTIESLRPADLVEITQEPKKVGREVGSFAIVKNRSGKPSAERAPVYRSIPTTNEMKPMSRTARISQASIKSNVGNRPVDIAKMDVKNNPFAREQKSKRFDIVL